MNTVKIIIIIAIIALFIFIDGWFFAKKYIAIDKRWKEYKIVNYKLNNKTYRLLVADSEEKWTKGLMDVETLTNLDGMIFVFPTKTNRNFWNENTHVDLNIYWLKDDKVVGSQLLPSIDKAGKKIITSPTEVNGVVELLTSKVKT